MYVCLSLNLRIVFTAAAVNTAGAQLALGFRDGEKKPVMVIPDQVMLGEGGGIVSGS